eukprot:1566378-Rhodomonas_salina.2
MPVRCAAVTQIVGSEHTWDASVVERAERMRGEAAREVVQHAAAGRRRRTRRTRKRNSRTRRTRR